MPDVVGVPSFELVERIIQPDFAARRPGIVAIVRVPGDIALEEQRSITEAGEPAKEAAIRRRMAVAPRRRDGEAEHDQPRGRHGASLPSSTASTSSARRA